VSTQTPPAGSQVITTIGFLYNPVVVPTGQVTIARDDTSETLGTATIDAHGVATIPFNAPVGSYFLKVAIPG